MNRRLLFADKTLNTSMLKDGIYYLKVKDDGRNGAVSKIIIQRK